MEGYKIKFYRNSINGKDVVRDYIRRLDKKDRSKIIKYIELLRSSGGHLDEPYSRHIRGKIRELRVDFSHNRYRIFYFTFIQKKIIILHAFLKKTKKTPENEIDRALKHYHDVINNRQMYELKTNEGD